MLFDPGAFNDLLGGLGEYFQWRRASACPCINPDSGSPSKKCPHCFGKGKLWSAAQRVAAATASSSVQQQWAKFGRWETGDLVLSIPEDSPLYGIAMFDRVRCETSTDSFSTVLIRGGDGERLQVPVQCITRVFWFDGAGAIVEGQAPAVADNGALTWSAGAPPAGKPYTIEGVKFQEYYALEQFSNDRMKSYGMRLPRRMVMRKFDLWGRT